MYHNSYSADMSMMNGTTIDIASQGCDSEIKADVYVSEMNTVRLWGQVLNCNEEPVANALIKLVKVMEDCSGKRVYQSVAHSVSDCNGCYQFDLNENDVTAKYVVMVNKSVVGTERVVQTMGCCNPCTDIPTPFGGNSCNCKSATSQKKGCGNANTNRGRNRGCCHSCGIQQPREDDCMMEQMCVSHASECDYRW